MAITREWQAGAESDGSNSHNTELMYHTWTGISSGYVKTGTYAFVLNDYGASWFQTYLLSATREKRCGLHFYPLGIPGSGDKCALIEWRSSTGKLGRVYIDNNFNVCLEIAGVTQDTAVGAQIRYEWTHWGVDIKIDSSSGWAYVYKNGVQVLSFTGNTGNADVRFFRYGFWEVGHSLSDGDWRLDDMFIDDTVGEAAAPLPDIRLPYITFDGNGNYSQCMGSDGNQVDNYLLVDEQPHDGETTYVEADAVDEKDTYACTTYSIPSGATMNALIPVGLCWKTNAAVLTKIAMMCRESSIDDVGSAQDISGFVVQAWERFVTKPSGGAWTQAALDAVEVGFAGKGTF